MYQFYNRDVKRFHMQRGMVIASIEYRLRLIADWCAPYERIVEIGAALGQLSRCLADRSHRVMATEINRAQTERLVRRLGESAIEVRTGFGLEPIREAFDCVVIAGMGGVTEKTILTKWDRVPGHPTYIVQPMQAWERLRAFLAQSGFGLIRSALVAEHGRIYPIWMVEPPEHPTIWNFTLPVEFRPDPHYGHWIEHILTERKKAARHGKSLENEIRCLEEEWRQWG